MFSLCIPPLSLCLVWTSTTLAWHLTCIFGGSLRSVSDQWFLMFQRTIYYLRIMISVSVAVLKLVKGFVGMELDSFPPGLTRFIASKLNNGWRTRNLNRALFLSFWPFYDMSCQGFSFFAALIVILIITWIGLNGGTDLICVQVDDFHLETRARVLQRQQNRLLQNQIYPFQENVIGLGCGYMKESGGTGVFHPRIVNPTTRTSTNVLKKKQAGQFY